MKKLINLIIAIPNFPFVLAFAIYLVIQIYKNTGATEMEFYERGSIEKNQQIKDYIKHVYPKQLGWIVAIVFYSLLCYYLFFNQ